MLQERFSNVFNVLTLLFKNLISITFLLTMRHDTEKTKTFNALGKNMIIKGIVDYCCSEDIVNKGLFILHGPQVVYKHHQNFSIA